MTHQPYPGHSEDTAFVRKYRSGDESAFKTLVEKHLDSVYAFLFQLVRDKTVAEDLAQETFIKVWRYLGRYDVEKPFRTWLFAIAKNTAYDWLKKKRAVPFSAFSGEEDGTGPFEHIPDTEPLPNELLEREDAAAELDRVIGLMAEKYRSLLSLVYQEGFSLHEAAEISGESYNTVKSRHQRAVLELRKRLSSVRPERPEERTT